jgi:hypothetical protein
MPSSKRRAFSTAEKAWIKGRFRLGRMPPDSLGHVFKRHVSIDNIRGFDFQSRLACRSARAKKVEVEDAGR